MKVITVDDVAKLIDYHGFDNIISNLVTYLKQDFSLWQEFDKSPRHATHVDGGVIELMPIADKKYYTFKYVNGHPKNPLIGKQTVVATGQISNAVTGYPLMFSEMTLLTALRTAATAIVATDMLARKDSSTLAIIGTGAQSEFQVLAHRLVRPIKNIRYFDIDPQAMQKFAINLAATGLNLIPCTSAEEAVTGADIVVVCTACKDHVDVILDEWVKPGMHINGLGGDCPGKTELELDILFRSKVVVEYIEQSFIEGEIQRLNAEDIPKVVHGELWELVTGKKPGRVNDEEITVFDSVGFALEDYSALRLIYDLANKYDIGDAMDFTPNLSDPKNLFSILNNNVIKEVRCE